MPNQAAVLKEAKARLTVEERPIPNPKPDEIVVKNFALATNPVDWKMQESGRFIESYPAILGSDIAGTVETVGSGVSHFKKGDRVTGFAHAISSKEPDNGAFQHYTALKAHASAKLPDSLGFDDACILPMSIATAGTGLFFSLEIPRPPVSQQGGFLVWGASSSVGSAAVRTYISTFNLQPQEARIAFSSVHFYLQVLRVSIDMNGDADPELEQR